MTTIKCESNANKQDHQATKANKALSKMQEYVEYRGPLIAKSYGVPEGDVKELVRKMIKFVGKLKIDAASLNTINCCGQWLDLKSKVESTFVVDAHVKTMYDIIQNYWLVKADKWPMLDKRLSEHLGTVGVNGDQESVARLLRLWIYRNIQNGEAVARRAAEWVLRSNKGERTNRLTVPFLVAEYKKRQARVLGGQITQAEACTELERDMEYAEVLRPEESFLTQSERSLVYSALYNLASLFQERFSAHFGKIEPERKRKWQSPERKRRRGDPVEVSPTDLDCLLKRRGLVKRTVCVERLVDNGPLSPRRVPVNEVMYLEANSAALTELDALIKQYRMPEMPESPAYRPCSPSGPVDDDEF
jgi:hypothetical protein